MTFIGMAAVGAGGTRIDSMDLGTQKYFSSHFLV
jgi:hypothetical protein